MNKRQTYLKPEVRGIRICIPKCLASSFGNEGQTGTPSEFDDDSDNIFNQQ